MTLCDAPPGGSVESLRHDLERVDDDLKNGKLTPATLLSRAGYSRSYVCLMMRTQIARHLRPHLGVADAPIDDHEHGHGRSPLQSCDAARHNGTGHIPRYRS